MRCAYTWVAIEHWRKLVDRVYTMCPDPMLQLQDGPPWFRFVTPVILSPARHSDLGK